MAPSVVAPRYFASGKSLALSLGYGPGYVSKDYGIVLTASETFPPAGSEATITWVQLIQKSVDKELNVAGVTKTIVPCGLATTPSEPELDTNYPYINGPEWTDAPAVGLSGKVEVAASFSATVYLMCDPALPTNCHPPVNDPSTEETIPSPRQSSPLHL